MNDALPVETVTYVPADTIIRSYQMDGGDVVLLVIAAPLILAGLFWLFNEWQRWRARREGRRAVSRALS